MTPEDRQTIEEGARLGMRPDTGDALQGVWDPLGARWLRYRAACARTEAATTRDCHLRNYLIVRAYQADNEAAAREAALGRMGR